MQKLFTIFFLSSLVLACSENRDTTPTTTSIDTTNSADMSKLGFQQFLALHSNEMLARNTIVASPTYTSPCTSGSYSASFNDANNNNALDKGDSVAEHYTSCVLNTGNIRISGIVSSNISDLASGKYTLDTQHTNLTVTALGNMNSYTFNGPIRTKITATLTLSDIENSYSKYTVDFRGTTTVINSGTAFVTMNSSDNSYSIKHSLVFSATGVTGLLRTDTTSEVTGVSIDNQGLYLGNPSLVESESLAIKSKQNDLTTEKNKLGGSDPAIITQLESDIKALLDTRKAFLAFVGRLRVESIIDNQFVEMTSEDSDNDLTTYQQNVRANRTTTSTLGHKWTDLL